MVTIWYLVVISASLTYDFVIKKYNREFQVAYIRHLSNIMLREELKRIAQLRTSGEVNSSSAKKAGVVFRSENDRSRECSRPSFPAAQ